MSKYAVHINSKIDIKQILEIYQAEKWWGSFAGDKKIMEKAVKGSYAIGCLCEGKVLAAVARVSSDGVSDAYIHDVAVRKGYRGKELGSRIDGI